MSIDLNLKETKYSMGRDSVLFLAWQKEIDLIHLRSKSVPLCVSVRTVRVFDLGVTESHYLSVKRYWWTLPLWLMWSWELFCPISGYRPRTQSTHPGHPCQPRPWPSLLSASQSQHSCLIMTWPEPGQACVRSKLGFCHSGQNKIQE